MAGVERDLRERLAGIPGVPVVTGFPAKDRTGRLTTLGRNGSDLTAAIVAEALAAAEMVLWKCVLGISSADPTLVPEARVLEALAFDDAFELARAGAEVIHPDALIPVRRSGALLRVADVARPQLAGTRLVEGPASTEPNAVAGRKGLARITLRTDGKELPLEELGAWAARLDSELETRLLAARPGEVELWVDEAALRRRGGTLALRASAHAALLESARIEGDLALVHLIGGPGPEVATRVLARLAGAGIEPLRVLAGQAERGQVFGLQERDYERAVRSLHSALLAHSLDAA